MALAKIDYHIYYIIHLKVLFVNYKLHNMSDENVQLIQRD